MISKTLGTSSRKFARLRERHPDVGLFAQALYPLIVASADDFGRLQGDAFTIKHSVWSTAPDPETKFEDALTALASEQLIERYDVGGETFLQVVDFDRHQAGLHKRTESCLPPPGGAMTQAELSVLDASELAIEERFAAGFLDGSIRISDWSVSRVERQVRRENSYLDLVITSNDGRVAVVELKRQRVTQSAVEQVLSYTRFYPCSVPIVIGHGIAASSLDAKGCIICTYGDDLCLRTVYKSTTPGLVNLTVESVEITSLLTEQNRTEQKGTKQNSRIVVDGGGFERFWRHYPKKVGKDAARRAFDRRSPDAALLDAMLAALDRQCREPSWLKDGGQFIPHPATWLNQGRWMDETTPAAVPIGAARRWSPDACPHTPPCGNATNCDTLSTVDAYKASR